jgi:signal transduction histidine kinase
MVDRKLSGLESVLGRLDDLDSVNLTILVQRLARERHLLETVFNTIREGILVISRDGVIEYANNSGYQLLGIRSKDAESTVLWKLVPDLRRSLNFEGDIPEDVHTGMSREVSISYPEPRVLRFYLVAFHDENPSDIARERFAVILTDITEEKSHTQKQIESERVDSILQLSAGVAHELGNPLNSLTIHLQLMERSIKRLEEDAMVPKLTKSLDICRREVDRLDGIIKHFLEAVRPSPPDMSDVDVFEILEDSMELVGPEMADAGLTVDVEIDNKLPIISGDMNQLKQVFFNLLKNAREATPRGGEIRIHARSDDEFVYLLIADTGEGIEPEDLANVFNPYFTTKKDGNGLGMMVVQRIMRDHGGQIGIDSKPGVGSVVTLQFPQKHRRVRMLESGEEQIN